MVESQGGMCNQKHHVEHPHADLPNVEVLQLLELLHVVTSPVTGPSLLVWLVPA
jgi:hypothetical protein